MTSRDLILCQVYKGGPHEEAYLFVDSKRGLNSIPDALRLKFANPIRVTRFELTPDRKMARANAPDVMRAIREKGFYLQMPPPREPHLAAIAAKKMGKPW